jgi:hypothetical protein
MTAAAPAVRIAAMLSHPLLLGVIVALVALLGWALWSMWHYRRVDVRSGADDAAAELFDMVIPLLVKDGYRTVASAGHTTVFERQTSLVGPMIISIVLFPIGMLALLARRRETITIVSPGTGLELYGCSTKPMADYLIAVADDVAARRVHVR